MGHNAILSNLFVGSCPRNGADIEGLKQLGVTAVLNLQTDDDMAHLDLNWAAIETCHQAFGVEVRRVPVRDYDHKDLCKKLPACVQALAELIQQGHTVYVHCTAGSGRSPSVVIAYLHWEGKWDLDKAESHVQQCRPCAPDMEAIRQAGHGERPREELG